MDILDQIIKTVEGLKKPEDKRAALSALLSQKGIFCMEDTPALNSKPTRVLNTFVK